VIWDGIIYIYYSWRVIEILAKMFVYDVCNELCVFDH